MMKNQLGMSHANSVVWHLTHPLRVAGMALREWMAEGYESAQARPASQLFEQRATASEETIHSNDSFNGNRTRQIDQPNSELYMGDESINHFIWLDMKIGR